MNFIDLKKDLELFGPRLNGVGGVALGPGHIVAEIARRAAELFRECPSCDGNDKTCRCCHGAGALPNYNLNLLGQPSSAWLANYLFGERNYEVR